MEIIKTFGNYVEKWCENTPDRARWLLTKGWEAQDMKFRLAPSKKINPSAQYLARMAVNGISFLISLLMATILVRSVTWMLNLISRLPVIHGMNKIAGAFLGAAKFLIVIWILFLALTIICNTELGETALQIIKKDYILSYLYDQDILIKIFMNIFYQ